MTTDIDPDKPVFVMPELSGPAGNAYNLLGMAHRAFREAGSPESLRDSFQAEATSGDYDHLLETIRTFFNVVVPVTEYRLLDPDEEWER